MTEYQTSFQSRVPRFATPNESRNINWKFSSSQNKTRHSYKVWRSPGMSNWVLFTFQNYQAGIFKLYDERVDMWMISLLESIRRILSRSSSRQQIFASKWFAAVIVHCAPLFHSSIKISKPQTKLFPLLWILKYKAKKKVHV